MWVFDRIFKGREHVGDLRTKFFGIPLVLFISRSYVYNLCDENNPAGKVYTLHITPFIGIGLIIPKYLLRKKDVR